MALTIGSGITFSGSITIKTELPPPPVLEYQFGNSMCYSGSGCDFGSFENYSGSSTDYIFDLQSDTANATLGNFGEFITNNGNASDWWVHQGPASYFRFDGGVSSTYIDSEGLTGSNIPANSSYSIFSVVKVNAFEDGSNAPTGAIVGGNSSTFGFLPPAALETPYPILVAAPISGGPPNTFVIDFTTQFEADTWYAVAVTFNAKSGTMKLYVNGVQTAGETGLTPFNSDEPLYWGTWEGFNWLDGNLGVATVWDRVLSDTEILEYTNNVAGPYLNNTNTIDNGVYTLHDTYTYVVPMGVTSLSMVAVGGGGSGTQDSYSNPGGDTVVYDNSTLFSASTTTTGTLNYITVDSVASPGVLDVELGYIVMGGDIDIVSNALPAFAIVTAIDFADLNSVVITINKTINATAGDSFDIAKCIVYAEGGYEIDNSYYNSGTYSPGPRARALIGDGGGRGGVVDYMTNWPIGGGAAGGYGISQILTASEIINPKVAFDPNQSCLYSDDDSNFSANFNTAQPGIVGELSNNNLTATGIGNTYYGMNFTGTYPIKPTDKVMFSLTLNTITDVDTMGIGLCNYNTDISYYVGGDVNSIGFWDSGNVYHNDSLSDAGYPVFTTGDVVDLAVDASNSKMWLRVNNGNWNNDPGANPASNSNGYPLQITPIVDYDNALYLFVGAGYGELLGQWTINTTSVHTVPSGFVFVGGNVNGGSSGGDGARNALATMKPGQYSSGAGGAGRYNDSGAGGGGTGLYGAVGAGATGQYISQDDLNVNYTSPIGDGGEGGSYNNYTGTPGGPATAWNGGFGGFPGGGGGSATGYYVAGNGGALAYKNNYTVAPGQSLTVVVGAGGYGASNGGNGAPGAVRIVYPGTTKKFPSTNVGV